MMRSGPWLMSWRTMTLTGEAFFITTKTYKKYILKRTKCSGFENVLMWDLFLPPPTSNAVAGESALDRIACGLGGKIILPMIKQHIMTMLQNRKLNLRMLESHLTVTLSNRNE